MKNKTLFAIIALFLQWVMVMPAQAEDQTPYERFSRAAEVKVYVALPKEAGVAGKVDPALFKRAVEKALTERKSIHFKVVENEAEAVVSVQTELQGFYFTEHDPVDMLIGAGMAAMDAMKQDHFARLEADMRLIDVKNTKVLWKDRLIASLTDEKMTEEESKIMILDRSAEVFVRSAFGKKRKQ